MKIIEQVHITKFCKALAWHNLKFKRHPKPKVHETRSEATVTSYTNQM